MYWFVQLRKLLFGGGENCVLLKSKYFTSEFDFNVIGAANVLTGFKIDKNTPTKTIENNFLVLKRLIINHSSFSIKVHLITFSLYSHKFRNSFC